LNVALRADTIRQKEVVPGRVSIIVPIYNRQAMLQQVLASATAQSYDDIEIIVIDDGSDDLTENDFHNISVNLSSGNKVTYLRKKNGGVASARNVGIDLSSGEFIHFLDSDDLLFPDAIDNLVTALSSSGESYCVGRVIDVDFGVRKTFGDFHRGGGGNILRGAEWNTHASLYRKDAVLALGGFDETLRVGEDTIFQVRMMLKYGQGAKSPAFVGVRRRHDFGHLSCGRVEVDDQARFMVAIADLIAHNEEFREEPYRVRLASTCQFLITFARVALARNRALRTAFHTIINALMHDSRLLLIVLKWLSARTARRRLVGALAVLTTARRLRAALLGWRRYRRRHELREAGFASAVARLSNLVSQPIQG
jgi:glycosyltransferase involved in cell wall biosynthesis